MAKLIAIMIVLSCMAFAPASFAKQGNVVETVTKTVRGVKVMFFPACDVENFIKICQIIVIRSKNETIASRWGAKNVDTFIAQQKLDSRFTNGDTELPMGPIFAWSPRKNKDRT
jgi:hypothetical protein